MNIWKKIQELIESGCELYLLTVIESTGSAPGRKGFKMLVANNGQLFGSIGGGVMEYKMVEKAKALLNNGIIEQQSIAQVHQGGSQASSGMICSGSQVIGFNYLCSDDLPEVNLILNLILNSSPAIEFSNNGICLKANSNDSATFKQNSPKEWSYTESSVNKPRAHIFGAGHVSVPTSQLLAQVGFDVFLYDNRNDINTFDSNNFVCEKRIVDYKKISEEVVIDSTDYILLMTHKFTEDKLLLSQLLNKNYRYLGILGSNNKIKVMFDALRDGGVSQKEFDKVYAPIGLTINSQTTAEIAVSIVAEMIKIKNS